MNEIGQQLEDIPEYMTLFQYILSPFGLTLKHKTWDHIFTGIIITIFTVFSLTILTSLSIVTPFYIIIIKIAVLSTLITYISAFILMKKIFSKIICMYEEICDYDCKYRQKKTTFDFTLIVFVITFIITYIVVNFNALYNPITDRMFSNNVVLLKLFYYQIAIISLLFLFWQFSIQFVVCRLCYQYYNLFKIFDKIIDKYLRYRPDVLLRHRIDQIFEKISETKNSFRLTIYLLNKVIVIQIIFVNLFLIIHILADIMIETNSEYSIMLIVFISVNLFFLTTELILLLSVRLQNRLLNKINIWKVNALNNNFNFDGKLKSSI